jgi:peptidoglycan/xylan/chitin deacetylase (PgdA/CDA1 family)
MTTTACISFDFDALAIWVSTFRQTTPTPLSRGEYGGRVGIHRVLDLLAEHEVPATFFVPAHSAASFPDAIKRMVAEGHEVASHGYLHETPVGLSLDEERDLLLRSREVLEHISGICPTGYRSPAWDLSNNSLSLLEEHGYIYDSSLMADDFRPFFARRGDRLDEHGFTPGEANTREKTTSASSYTSESSFDGRRWTSRTTALDPLASSSARKATSFS